MVIPRPILCIIPCMEMTFFMWVFGNEVLDE